MSGRRCGWPRLTRDEPFTILRLLGEARQGMQRQCQRDDCAGTLDVFLNH
jgi:hypothetical protein